ncbi:MAG: AsnC family transcriptional regulator [Actinomycetota bacterium]|nr:AsnC family transcriptional regulator [Actinomycetota bacterium]
MIIVTCDAVDNPTLLTNHGLVLVCVGRHPGMRLREIGDCVGITERAAQRILGDLCQRGYVSRRRVGRRNVYEIHPDVGLEHPLLEDRRLGDLLAGLVEGGVCEAQGRP